GYHPLLRTILEVHPSNLPMPLRSPGSAYERTDMAAFGETLKRLDRLKPGWPPDQRNTLDELHKAARDAPAEVPILLAQLDNLLKAVRGYSRDYAAINPQPNAVGASVQHFLRLQPPRPTPAPPDRALAFTVGPW